MNINGTSVKFCLLLSNFGIDSTLSQHQRVLNVCRGAFLELRHINSICNFLTTDAVKILVRSWFCHVLTFAILYSQVYLSVCLRRYNMCKILQQRWFFGHQNIIMSRPFSKSFTWLQNRAQNVFIVLQLFIWNWATILIRSNPVVYIF